MGKYGLFPSNLIIHRPFHLTYELVDKQEGESFCRLRVVPASELYADVLAEDDDSLACPTPADESDQIISAADGVEYALVDPDSGSVVVSSNREVIDDNARQTLTAGEIEELKRDGTGAGKDIIAKLLLSHTALDQKTSFSLAKYKLLKTKKYIRRFQVLPLDVPTFGNYLLEEKDASRILDIREEMIALVGCWSNVHYAGEDVFLGDQDAASDGDNDEELLEGIHQGAEPLGGRWLVIDDTSGLLVAAMAERMGILYPQEEDGEDGRLPPDTAEVENSYDTKTDGDKSTNGTSMSTATPKDHEKTLKDSSAINCQPELVQNGHPPPAPQRRRYPRQPRLSDFCIPYSQTNTITLIHSSGQPNLSFLNYYNFDVTNPNPPPHPLATHLLPLSWLQLLNPSLDTAYITPPPIATPEQLAAWKPNRRGNYHRKRRRYARTRHIVDTARAGNYSGLVCASAMDPVSILRHTLPLLAGGAPIAIYSASPEPLTELADCFSVGRRAAWAGADFPAELAGKTAPELERWGGSPDFPVNPTLLLGATVQTSRARAWQVLPKRTHPLMTARGGPDGYVFTGWKARPAEGRVEARGKYKRRKKGDKETAMEVEPS